jgi:hypothetical protein
MKSKTLKLLIAIAIVLTSTHSFAQKWKNTRHEIYGGLGASNFIGELGGADNPGSLQFIRNYNFTDSRPSMVIGYRYQISPLFRAKAAINTGILAGDDAKTKEPYRNARNLSFRAPVVEFTVQGEFYLMKEKSGQVYRMQGFSSNIFSNLSTYLYTGFGGFWFNPQAKYNGNWVNLQPLGTEGQGIEPGVEKYSRFSYCIPYGFGIKYSLSRQLSVGFEYGSRLTFTDYIDDVSTNYYDNDKIRSTYGDMAADLADRNQGPNYSWTGAGEQRGNPDRNDFFLFANFTVNYKILAGKTVKPRF